MIPEQKAAWWVQVNVESLPDGPANPHGVGFVANETVLRSEKEAQRMGDLNTSRIWKIKNPNSINPLNGELSGNAVCACLRASHVSATVSVLRKLLVLSSLHRLCTCTALDLSSVGIHELAIMTHKPADA